MPYDPKQSWDGSASDFSINLCEDTISKLSSAQKVSIFFKKLTDEYKKQGYDPYDTSNASITVHPFLKGYGSFR